MKPKLTLQRFLIRRLLVLMGIFTIALSAIGEAYARKLAHVHAVAKLDATMSAFTSSLRGDLEAGDVFSLRKILESGLRSGQFTKFQIVDQVSGEEIIRIPFFKVEEQISSSIQAEATVQSNNGYSSWIVRAEGDPKWEMRQLQSYRATAGIVALILLAAVAVFSWTTSRRLAADIHEIQRALIGLSNTNSGHIPDLVAKVSVRESAEAILIAEKTAHSLSASMKQNEQLAADAAVGLMATQIAHDIRSPVSALQMVSHSLTNLTDEQRDLIKAIAGRIGMIANDLMAKSREKTLNHLVQNERCVGLLEKVIAEKSAERPGLRIKLVATSESQNTWCEINASGLMRVVSNLLNNSIEATADDISIQARLVDDRLRIDLKDNGHGIPNHVVSKLAQRNFSHGKSGGNGLGLFSAKQTLEKWGGSLAISSVPGKYTVVSLELPIASKMFKANERAVLPDRKSWLKRQTPADATCKDAQTIES